MANNQDIADVDRSLYDFRDDESDFYRLDEGLTEEIVSRISDEKHDPDWMREFRLKSLRLYEQIPVPNWGPPVDGLDMDHIAT